MTKNFPETIYVERQEEGGESFFIAKEKLEEMDTEDGETVAVYTRVAVYVVRRRVELVSI